MAILTVPSAFTIAISAKPKVGRTKFIMVMFTLTAISCLGSEYLLLKAGDLDTCENSETADLYRNIGRTMAFIGKFFVSAVFSCLMLYSSEVYSTDVRAELYGFCNFMGKIGSTIAPYILVIKQIISWGPGVLFGLLSLSSALIALSMPETIGSPMLMNMDEATKYYKKGKK